MSQFFSQDALNPGVKKREVMAWAMYDFANSGYTTVVLTAVYATYFVGGIANSASWATLAWTVALSISYAIVMFTMPLIGAYADAKADKKQLLMLSTIACVLTTALLYYPQPGHIFASMLLIVLSNVFYSYGESLTAAFLPELAKPEAMGRVSGWGWSFGYFGGMLVLAFCLGYVSWAESHEIPPSQYVPVTMLMTAFIYGLAATFTMIFLKERAKPKPNANKISFLDSFKELKKTFHHAKSYPDFMMLLACAVAYQGGVAVAITLAAIYAKDVVGFSQQETMVLIFALNIAAAIGAFSFGYIQDKIGSKLALGITLVAWIVTCALAAASTDKWIFWLAATLAGLSMGSSQSAGRAMAGLFSPESQRAEFFGLWTFATRLASIIGPLSYGIIAWVTNGNQRIAILSTTLFFVVGLILLQFINMQRGIQTAKAAG